ncbi:MAG TPA: isoaspartyl peptidase/L-asparaginase [Oscillatoriaceae cyanobacterium]
MAPRVQIAVHGGVGNSPANLDGCTKAAEAGMRVLSEGLSALQAAVVAAVHLEDDGRFNAGSGSSLRMDGETIEMDAACMDSTGMLGAVAAIQKVKNPILVARAVADTPHWLLVGEGATAFARVMGFPEYTHVTERARAIHAKVLAALSENAEYDFQEEWRSFDYKRHWNFKKRWQDVIQQHGSSTIGAVAMDAEGNFAVCNSTGGSSPMLYGRVGDSPIIGCGFYAGLSGAIAVTGIGEHIVKHMLARTVYGWIEAGMPLQDALDKGVGLYPQAIDIGLIGVTRTEAATSDNRQMPTAILQE